MNDLPNSWFSWMSHIMEWSIIWLLVHSRINLRNQNAGDCCTLLIIIGLVVLFVYLLFIISCYCLKTSKEITKIRDELNEKVSEIKSLQMELSRREDESRANAVDSLKRLIKTLEKENVTLKVGKLLCFTFSSL